MPVVGLNDSEILVVIPACNSSDLTIRCIEHLKQSTEPVAVLYVDNGSTDDHWRTVNRECWEAASVRFGSNRGFTAAVQYGVEAAIEHGKHLLILNNDCFVSSVCTSRMLAALNRSRLGSVCPLTRDYGACSLRRWINRRVANVSNRQSASPGIQNYLTTPRTRSLSVLPWFCCLLHRDAIREVPLLPDSESMRSGLGVDDWWSITTGRLGWKHAIALNAFAEHMHSETFKRMAINRRAEQKKAVAWLQRNL